MRKIVINTNRQHGGSFLSLSPEANEAYTKASGRERFGDVYYYGFYNGPRDNPQLVEVVKRLGSAANGRNSDMKVIEIPFDVKWHIHKCYSGEEIHSEHQTWK